MIGAALSLSSSAFVLQLMAERNELGTKFGSATLGILLFQARHQYCGPLVAVLLLCSVHACHYRNVQGLHGQLPCQTAGQSKHHLTSFFMLLFGHSSLRSSCIIIIVDTF